MLKKRPLLICIANQLDARKRQAQEAPEVPKPHPCRDYLKHPDVQEAAMEVPKPHPCRDDLKHLDVQEAATQQVKELEKRPCPNFGAVRLLDSQTAVSTLHNQTEEEIDWGAIYADDKVILGMVAMLMRLTSSTVCC
jgi:hypothetical protein